MVEYTMFNIILLSHHFVVNRLIYDIYNVGISIHCVIISIE